MNISKQVTTILQEIELQGWLVLMLRYRDNKPIQVSLERSLYAHFRKYWLTDRMPEITEGGYLDYLPKDFKRTLVVNFIFDDVVHCFRAFFQPHSKTIDSRMIELMCYGLTPRYYNGSEEEPSVLLDESDEVLEIVFI